MSFLCGGGLYRLRKVNRTLVLLVVVIVALLAVLGLVVLLLGNHLHARAGAAEWPGGLGPLTSAPGRFPATKRNAAAERFSQRAAGVPGSIGYYVTREAERAERAIELDANVAELLTEHNSTLELLRHHVLTGGEMTWDHDPEKGFSDKLPPLDEHLDAARAFIARALLRAHDGDVRAWDDLRAAWLVAASLHGSPDALSQGYALNIAGLVTATAWKLPLPVPPWFEAVKRYEPEQFLARSAHYEAWVTWAHVPRGVVKEGLWLLWPLAKIGVAYSVNRQRETLGTLLDPPDCAFDADRFIGEQVPRWNVVAREAFARFYGSWNSAYRYRAEREATVNALRLAAGEPVIAASRCEGGTWSAEALPDRAARLKFSGKVGKPDKALELSIPLERTLPARTEGPQ
jgi:hypothetical protein